MTFGNVHLILLALSAVVAVGYVLTKHWILSNLYGEVFSITAIELLQLDSFKTGMILLSGLFFYDIFWVFGGNSEYSSHLAGTDVMVTVAKSFDAPIKVVWPKDIMALVQSGILNTPEGTKFSLLGLGDIVLPGVFCFVN